MDAQLQLLLVWGVVALVPFALLLWVRVLRRRLARCKAALLEAQLQRERWHAEAMRLEQRARGVGGKGAGGLDVVDLGTVPRERAS